MTASPRTRELLEQLRIAVHADHRRRTHRRRGAVIAALVAAALTGGAWAAATQAPWWQSGAPPVDPTAVALVAKDNMPANVDVSHARTVAQAGDAALVAAPLDQSGYCLIPTLGGRGGLGAQCEYQVINPAQGDDDRLESYAQPAGRLGGPAWIVYGRITDPRAAAIDLGPLTIKLRTGGFFLATVPTDHWSTLDGSANPGAILDAAGSILRRGCVNWGPSPDAQKAGETDTILWQNGSGPCAPQTIPNPPTIDVSRAEKLFDVTLSADYSLWKAGTTITVSRAPASDGTVCMVVTGQRSQPGNHFGMSLAGGGCDRPDAAWPAPSQPLDATLGAQLTHVDGTAAYVWVALGRIDPGSGIARIELDSPAGTFTVPEGGGYFFVQLPGTSTTANELPGSGPTTLVGYNAAGEKVATTDLTRLQQQASPH
jgi:hypothetical protein